MQPLQSIAAYDLMSSELFVFVMGVIYKIHPIKIKKIFIWDISFSSFTTECLKNNENRQLDFLAFISFNLSVIWCFWPWSAAILTTIFVSVEANCLATEHFYPSQSNVRERSSLGITHMEKLCPRLSNDWTSPPAQSCSPGNLPLRCYAGLFLLCIQFAKQFLIYVIYWYHL